MKYTDDFFSMIRHVSYLTRRLQEDLMLRDLIASTQYSMVDVPRYYVLQRRLDKIRAQTYPSGSIWNNTSTGETYLRIGPLKQGIRLDDPMPLNPPEIPDGLKHAYQEWLKARAESLDNGIGFGVMLEGLKEVGDKKDFPPNWGKVNF